MTTEKLIDKIRKLLALAGSPNEHEAAAAAARAAELMQEHQIAEAQLRIEDDEAIAEPVIEGEVEARIRMSSWWLMLAEACARSVGAHSWTRRVAIDGKLGTAIKLHGRESAIQTATYQFEYLTREIERLAHIEYCTSGMRENSRSWKTSFCHGESKRDSWKAAALSSNRLRAPPQVPH